MSIFYFLIVTIAANSGSTSSPFGTSGSTGGQPSAGNLFGNTASAPSTGFLFGSSVPTANTTNTAGPTSNPTSGSALSFGGANSTTPSFGSASTGGLLFGTATPAKPAPGTGLSFPPAANSSISSTSASLFGTANTPALGTTATPAPSGSLFGSANAAGPANTATFPSAPTGLSFGSTGQTPASTGSTLFGTTATAASTGKIETTKPVGGLFGSNTVNSSTTPGKPSVGFNLPSSTTSASAPVGSAGPFGAVSTLATATAPAAVATAPAATATLASVTKPVGGSVGFTLGGSSTPAKATSSTANVFGTPAAKEGASHVPAPATQTETPGPLKLADLGGKTATPATQAVPAGTISSLKNKTVGEILDKWSNELDVYSKEFHRIATQVMGWDRLLLENGHQIQGLYGDLKAAQSTQKEIDANLELIEAQQSELSQLLDVYEKNVQEIVNGSNEEGKPGLKMAPTDKDREQTYKLAQDLNQQMDDMTDQLKVIIEQVNKTRSETSSANQNSISVEEETPISQIVSILNNHLISINAIDDETKNLADMITQVEKLSVGAKRDADRVHTRQGMFYE